MSMTATTYGVGQAILAALKQGKEIETVIICLGGSASTDGGVGALWLIPLTQVRLYVACAVGRRRDPRLRLAWGRVFGRSCEDCLV